MRTPNRDPKSMYSRNLDRDIPTRFRNPKASIVLLGIRCLGYAGAGFSCQLEGWGTTYWV